MPLLIRDLELETKESHNTYGIHCEKLSFEVLILITEPNHIALVRPVQTDYHIYHLCKSVPTFVDQTVLNIGCGSSRECLNLCW